MDLDVCRESVKNPASDPAGACLQCECFVRHVGPPFVAAVPVYGDANHQL